MTVETRSSESKSSGPLGVDVGEVLQRTPQFDRFLSVDELETVVGELAGDPRFEIAVAGTSPGGRPIHHIRIGRGAVKALIVGGVHAMEPIGALTIVSLLTALRDAVPSLIEANVEWHVVPCIDPDGAQLNEGWSQGPFSLETFMKNYYVQAPRDQVEGSFAISYKTMRPKSPPSAEAEILKSVIDQVGPDFYFPLHNARVGGAFFLLGHGIDQSYYERIYALLEGLGFPLQKRPIWREICAQFSPGVSEMFSQRKYYDYLAQTHPAPEGLIPYGGSSSDYVGEVRPQAQILVAELGYARHPDDESTAGTGENLRLFKMQVETDSKYLATILLKHWDAVKDEVDKTSPFYRALIGGGAVLPRKEQLRDGGQPLGRYTTDDTLFNPQHDREMTAGDRFDACFVDGGFMFLHMSYQLVRLLKASEPTPRILRAIEELEPAFDEALDRLGRHIDLTAFEVFDCATLAKVQLGAGLIVLNSILEAWDG
jgi:hypothetical protein